MSGFLGAIGGGADLLGGVLGFMGTQSTNAANAQQAQQQMAFQAAQADMDRAYNAQQAGYAADRNVLNADAQFNYNRWLQGNAQDFSANQADIARQFDAAQTQAQMGFQWQTMQEAERYNQAMSSTAYQRGVADMKAAGINPILAAGQGAASSPSVGAMSGASASSPSPSGTSASVGLATAPAASFSTVPPGAKAEFRNPYESLQTGVSSAVSSALQATKLGQELQGINQQIKESDSRILLQGEQANLARSQAGAAQASTARDQQSVAESIWRSVGTGGQSEVANRQASARAADASAGASSAAARASDMLVEQERANAALAQKRADYLSQYGQGWEGDLVGSISKFGQRLYNYNRSQTQLPQPRPGQSPLSGGYDTNSWEPLTVYSGEGDPNR